VTKSPKALPNPLFINITTLLLWTQSYDFDLQRQRGKFLQRHGQPSAFWKLIFLFYFEIRSSLLQRWRCSCKFKSRRIDSWKTGVLNFELLLYVIYKNGPK
jgi:hypothetical protein